MVFNKKRSFLYISILLLILVGVYFVNSIGFVSRTAPLSTGFVTTNTSVVTFNGNQTSTGFVENFQYTELANWTRGGTIELFNFTINITSDATLNITKFNITLPTSGFSNITIAYTNNISVGSEAGGLAGFSNNWSLDINRDTSTTYAVYSNFLGASLLTSNGAINTSNVGKGISLWFNVIAANGTEAVYNWTIAVTNSTNGTIDSGFGVLTGLDGLPPRLLATNVTDGPNLRTSFSGTQYLRYDTTDLNTKNTSVIINLTVTDYNLDRVLLVYNNTGGSLNLAYIRSILYNVTFLSNFTGGGIIPFSNFSVLENAGPTGGKANYTTLDTRSDVRLASAPTYLFTFNISNATWGLGASDGTTFKYVFVVYDLYNNTEVINNSNAEYVLGRDVNNPSVTLTEPSDLSIRVFDPLKFTCNGADTSHSPQ